MIKDQNVVLAPQNIDLTTLSLPKNYLRIVIMKKFVLITTIFAVYNTVTAQENKFSDEELKNYASVMVWAEAEKGRMTDLYNGWINNNQNLDPARFVEIKNTYGDSLKMETLYASEVELEAFALIQSNYDSMTNAFKEVYISKIKEDIGAGLYNSMKKALKADTDLKIRYSDLYDTLLMESRLVDKEGIED